MPGEIIRQVARVPVVPDDYSDQGHHKLNEIVIDPSTDNIYLKKSTGYENLTQKIIDQIRLNATSAIHIVTEETVPPIINRKENHQYWIIEDAETTSGQTIDEDTYIYYGLIRSTSQLDNYLLIAQNTTTGTSTIKFDLEEGYTPCLYIPATFTSASFQDHTTHEDIAYDIIDRTYALNTYTGSYVTYDVYLLDISATTGTLYVDIILSGSNYYTINFSSNEPTVSGLVLPETKRISIGSAIGTIADPTWTAPRWQFEGWSTSATAKTLITPASYVPDKSMMLFAWFTYNDNTTLLEYYSNYSS